MRNYTQRPHPQRLRPAARQVPRPTVEERTLDRSIVLPERTVPPLSRASAAEFEFAPDPYVDYGRFLTAEGGILIVYKDINDRLRHTLWRVFAWSAFTGPEAWFLFYHSPLQSTLLSLIAFAAIALLNWLIVAPPVEVYRSVEIRPDCMIVNGADVFWLKYMECGWPSLGPGKDNTQILMGIYGTRMVEYLTLRRFDDEFDRAWLVFASHLKDAMQQLWSRKF
jgi:hypothetical protein